MTVASAAATTRMRPSVPSGFPGFAVAGGVLIALVIGAGSGRGDRPDAQVGVPGTPGAPTPSGLTAGDGVVATPDIPTASGATNAGEGESRDIQATDGPDDGDGSGANPVVDAGPPIVASAIPPDLATALEASGIHLTPLASGVAVPDAEALQAAIDLAHATFGPAGTSIAIPATVTVDGYHTGDENSPLVIENRPVIAVQITGLSMPPHGKYGDPPAHKSEYNTELVVLVDAATGEYLMASSIR